MNESFWSIFFSNELIIILLAILVIVLVILIIYMIKLNKATDSNQSEDKEEIDLLDDLKKETISFTDKQDENEAIINVDELIASCNNIKEETGLNNSEIIDMYEKEQEKKAIISYEELLKNASALNIRYEEPKEKNMEEPNIKIIEIEEEKTALNSVIESTNKVISYVKEEEFLKLLKRFRMDLET